LAELANFVLQSVDTAFLQSTISKTMQKSASVHLLFGFEYVILASIVVSVSIKYTLSLIDNYLEGRWENKVQLHFTFPPAPPPFPPCFRCRILT